MSAEDWLLGDEPPGAVCKYCGRDGLSWEQYGERWVLVDERTSDLHKCRTPLMPRSTKKKRRPIIPS